MRKTIALIFLLFAPTTSSFAGPSDFRLGDGYPGRIEPYTASSAKTEGVYLHESVDTAWDYIIKPDESGTYSCEVQYWKKSGDAPKTFSFQFSVFTCSLTAKNPLFQFTDDTAPWAAFLHRRSTSEINPTTSIELQPQPDANGFAPNAIIVSDPAGFLKNGNNIVSATSETSGIVCGVGRFACPYTQIPISSEMYGNSLVLSVETNTSMVIPMNRAGCLQPIGLAVFDMYIVSPSGEAPPDGEAGNSEADSADDALWVFDKENDGECHIICKAASLEGIKDDGVREEIWKRLKWTLPSCGSVSPNSGSREADTWKFDYESMPSNNSDFGAKEDGVALSIEGTGVAPWSQSVQFRFKKDGTSASKMLNPVNFKNGDSNWYVYWQQVAKQFGFGPQCGMVYDPSPRGENEDEIGNYKGSPVYSSPSYIWNDSITLFDDNKVDIVECIKTIHHENGHRQVLQKANSEGGWGDKIEWNPSLDRDVDSICDLFETNSEGSTFSVETGQAPVERDQKAWAALAHDNQKGQCMINEAAVSAHEEQIKENDWSLQE